MKPRDLLPIIERVRRSTSHGEMVTICDELSKRLMNEMADAANVRSANPPSPAVPRTALPKNKGKRPAANLR